MGQKMRDEIAAGIAVGSKGSVAKLATALLSRQSASLGMASGRRRLAGLGRPHDPDGGMLAQAPVLLADDRHRRRHQRDPAQHHR